MNKTIAPISDLNASSNIEIHELTGHSVNSGTIQIRPWNQELADSFTCPEALLEYLQLDRHLIGDGKATELFKLRVPRPYAARMKKGDPNDPLFLQVWPRDQEFDSVDGYLSDPLEERSSNPVPGLLHKYGKRVLTISAASCAINCRYCFRRHFHYQEQSYGQSVWREWLDYLNKHPEIDEVILSGGEPLLMSDRQLAQLHDLLVEHPGLKRIRIHTRMPLVIPQRITQELLSLVENSPLQWIMVWHINHPNEIDETVSEAMRNADRHGFLQFNQSVLLKGVNNQTCTLQQLSEKLIKNKVTPYYLHLPDKVKGTHHFDISESEARAIHQQLLETLSGFMVPKLVREIPSKRSKTPMS